MLIRFQSKFKMSVQEAFRRKITSFREIDDTHLYLESRGFLQEFEKFIGPLFKETSHVKALVLRE